MSLHSCTWIWASKSCALLNLFLMHRVLQIAEVLREIIFHCDSRTNFANALVSKTWSEISLDALWYTADLTSFVNLFGELPESRASSNTFVSRHGYSRYKCLIDSTEIPRYANHRDMATFRGTLPASNSRFEMYIEQTCTISSKLSPHHPENQARRSPPTKSSHY